MCTTSINIGFDCIILRNHRHTSHSAQLSSPQPLLLDLELLVLLLYAARTMHSCGGMSSSSWNRPLHTSQRQTLQRRCLTSRGGLKGYTTHVTHNAIDSLIVHTSSGSSGGRFNTQIACLHALAIQ